MDITYTNSSTFCVVFVCNAQFLNKFYNIASQLRSSSIGNYSGDITLIIGLDLCLEDLQKMPFMIENKINIVQYPDIDFPEKVKKDKANITGNDGRHQDNRVFQWHKMWIFSTYFKKWDYILYLDCGMKIYRDIRPLLDLRKPNILLAHQDAFPTFEWDLKNQFDMDPKHSSSSHILLNHPLYKDILDTHNYFQTGLLLFDSNIIQNNTFTELYSLAVQFPMSKTNEQGIINLYYLIRGIYNPLPIHTSDNKYYIYDFQRRFTDKPYIITARDF